MNPQPNRQILGDLTGLTADQLNNLLVQANAYIAGDTVSITLVQANAKVATDKLNDNIVALKTNISTINTVTANLQTPIQ